MLFNHIGDALACAAMLGKVGGGFGGLLRVDFRLRKLPGCGLNEFGCAVDLLGNACGKGFLAGSLKIVNGRAEQHGFAALQGFDDVLAARVYKAAADEDDVGSLKIGIHFAHAVAYPHLGVGADGGVVAAFLGVETALSGELVGSLKTLGVARDKNEQGVGVRLPCVEYEFGFVLPVFFAQTGSEENAAVADSLAKLGGKFAGLRRDGNIVFGVAANDGGRRAELLQALGIGGGLGADGGELAQGGTDETGDFLVVALGFFG